LEISRNNLVAQRMELDNKLQIVAENYDLTNAEKEALESQRNEIAAKTSEIDQLVQQEQARIVAEEKARREAEEAARRQAEAEARERAQAAAQAAKTASASQTQTVQAASSSPAPAPSPVPAPTSTGGWVRPASGGVTSEFGYRIHPVHGTRRLHAGIDLGGGGAIRAAKSGTVRSASYHPTLGYFVVIDHGGGISTTYGHMTPGLQVAPGQSVSAGQTIGTMGTTGTSTGVHLHFEVHVNGAPVNPRGYVNF
ncbi:MAG TPA: M23 family metallopeptidase, partial [Atopostipes sp.]|nr:M23 family metallopeptidase [Atopostipes sp.]